MQAFSYTRQLVGIFPTQQAGSSAWMLHLMLPGILFFTSVPSLYLEIESGPPRQGLSPTGLPPAPLTCQWPVLLTVSVSQIPYDITLGSVNLLEQLTKLGNRLMFTRLL